MSPASLRRYRAERLLREEFRTLRAGVLATVHARLRACGAELDAGDLEACYAQAWQGLYAATLDGQQIVHPHSWLAVVTFRRAVDEHRAQARAGLGECARPERDELAAGAERACDPDIATQLDQRRRLRQLLEGLRLALSERERHAATLCYLQGYSRRQAARSMGVSEARMRKLMEGQGGGRPGVAGKVAALAETIAAGSWCEEQGSLMRGLAYGILDPRGERHRLALAHAGSCPACRAYVASLRGLAAVLPPVPALLARVLAGHRAAAALQHVTAAASGKAAAAALPAGGAGGALPAPAAVSSGAAASGAAGAAGGGWLLAGGGIGAKLAAGCVIALGVGAGCVVLGAGHRSPASSARVHARARAAPTRPRELPRERAVAQVVAAPSPPPAAASGRPARASAPLPAGVTPASREFGLEAAGAGAGRPRPAPSPARAQSHAVARSASASSEFTSAAAQPAPPAAAAPAPAAPAGSGASSPAQREFSPG